VVSHISRKTSEMWGTRPSVVEPVAPVPFVLGFPSCLEAWGSGRRGGGLYCWSADADPSAAGVLLGS